MWWMWWSPAVAADPIVEEVVEIVEDDRELDVKLVFAGREGDPIKVDGWAIGRLPLETKLVEGIHVFEINGPKGRTTVTTRLEANGDAPVTLDLENATPAKASAPTGIRVIGETSMRRNADGSITVPEPEPLPVPKPAPATPDADSSPDDPAPK